MNRCRNNLRSGSGPRSCTKLYANLADRFGVGWQLSQAEGD